MHYWYKFDWYLSSNSIIGLVWLAVFDRYSIELETLHKVNEQPKTMTKIVTKQLNPSVHPASVSLLCSMEITWNIFKLLRA